MTATSSKPAAVPIARNRPLLTLMLGHFSVDSYVGILPVLYPLLVGRFDLDLKTLGLVSLAYSGTASLAQPFFGWVADRFGTRFIGLALIWSALVFATIGFAPSFELLLLLAALAGLGSGAFHPMGALSANRVIGDHQRNTAMSVYVTGGTLGVASGPLIGIALFALFGTQGTVFTALPGLLIAAWMLWELRRLPAVTAALPRQTGQAATIPWRKLLLVIAVMMSFTWTLYGVESFVPTWYAGMGYPPLFYGALATVLLLANAVGAVSIGRLADSYGRRRVVLVSLLLGIPALLLFTSFAGPIAFVTGTMLGLVLAGVGPLMLLTAQQLMAGRAGMAAGMILGLGFVTGAIGVPVTGAIADSIGLQQALQLQALVLVLALGLAWFLPDDR